MTTAALAARVTAAIGFWNFVAGGPIFEQRDNCERELPCVSVFESSALERNELGLTFCAYGACNVAIRANAPTATVVHELGHVLGLHHATAPDDLMRPTLGGACLDESRTALRALGIDVRFLCMPATWEAS